MATVPMVTVVVGSLIATMSARVLVEANFDLFGVGLLIGGCDHLANPRWWLVIEHGAVVAVMESSDKGCDDLSFRDVRNRIPHLEKSV